MDNFNELYYTIFTVDMAIYLINKGFELVLPRVDKKDSNKLVYIFRKTPELEDCIKSYRNQ